MKAQTIETILDRPILDHGGESICHECGRPHHSVKEYCPDCYYRGLSHQIEVIVYGLTGRVARGNLVATRRPLGLWEVRWSQFAHPVLLALGETLHGVETGLEVVNRVLVSEKGRRAFVEMALAYAEHADSVESVALTFVQQSGSDGE